jgi:hypothetical protein
VILNIAAIVEKADEQVLLLLGARFLHLGLDFRASQMGRPTVL